MFSAKSSPFHLKRTANVRINCFYTKDLGWVLSDKFYVLWEDGCKTNHLAMISYLNLANIYKNIGLLQNITRMGTAIKKQLLI
ncbi:hypothetical protein CHU_1952 [Cytophaga hutchinsonii ATCC 33406]|uniref:Uncharacterized protein n=1 Tax=Cytophaga hutchinsonii (strain ATCC 33406 / DSM 1761 / CIP 103989 / NBRC 15051 / NCIMB 9469 / D465) TaxID=269798 RepID=A0A6N4SSE1_CYTH3|nr:hypothetical protein CHU_1952 [Cytophaga hutchinsonii ATCC 33406]